MYIAFLAITWLMCGGRRRGILVHRVCCQWLVRIHYFTI